VLGCQVGKAGYFLKTDFIRPEDLVEYEKLGITWFKITERGHPTNIIHKRIDAYRVSFKIMEY